MKKFIIEQKITALVNQYRVYDASDADGSKQLISFAQQKRLAMKEQVQVYADEAKNKLAFTIAAEKVIDLHGKFFIRDEAGKPLGTLRKAFKSSILRSTYELMDADEKVLAIVRERSYGIAVFRRVWGFIPFAGELPFPIKYHFDFIDPKSGAVLARYNKTTLIRDNYELLIDDENLLQAVGWQVLAAQAIMLDVMQDR